MTKNRIIRLIIAAILLTAGVVLLLTKPWEKPKDLIIIKSDGQKYEISNPDKNSDNLISQEIILAQPLQAIGDKETLLEILSERGALYDPNQNNRPGLFDMIFNQLRKPYMLYWKYSLYGSYRWN